MPLNTEHDSTDEGDLIMQKLYLLPAFANTENFSLSSEISRAKKSAAMENSVMMMYPMPLPFLIISTLILILFSPLLYLVTVYLPEMPIRALKRRNYLQFDVT